MPDGAELELREKRGAFSRAAQRRKLELVWLSRLLRAGELEPGQRVLEPGCGAGRLTQLLARAVGSRGMVLALEAGPELVLACRHRVRWLDQVEVYQATAQGFWAPAASIDCVVCHQDFASLAEQAVALGRLAGFLRPGGLFLLAGFRGAGRETFRPGPGEMEDMLGRAGLRGQGAHEDGLGYWTKARRED